MQLAGVKLASSLPTLAQRRDVTLSSFAQQRFEFTERLLNGIEIRGGRPTASRDHAAGDTPPARPPCWLRSWRSPSVG